MYKTSIENIELTNNIMARNSYPANIIVLCFILLPRLFTKTCFCEATTEENKDAVQNISNNNVKGLFVFGSSLVDNGNNNLIKDALAKANYSPYGKDFPLGPSGRFNNGKNVIDLIGEQLGIPTYIPVFNDPSTRGSKIIHGVNFASGGSGIHDETSFGGGVISVNQQIKNFEDVILPELEAQMLCKHREPLLNYLFVVGAGGNDYTANYFRKPKVSPEAFTANLTANLHHQLERLYGLGARKFVVMSLYPIGCSPCVVKARHPKRKRCVHSVNLAALLFNAHLKKLMGSIKQELPDLTYSLVDSFRIITDILKNPASAGFNDTSNACCEVDSKLQGVMCARGGSVCANRSTHVYFDGLHPTQALNAVLATKAFASNLRTEVYPINVKQLAQT